MKRAAKILFIVLVMLGILLFLLLQIFTVDDIPIDQLKAKYAQDGSQFIKVQDQQVHYRIDGVGPAVILLHGTASSLHTWDAWTEILGKEYKVIRLDLPAFGLTGPNANHDYSMDSYVDFIDEFASFLGIDSFHLAGNSLGGRIAWEYAYQYPENVDKLILIDAAGFPTQPIALFKLIKNPILGPLVKQITHKYLVEKNLKEIYADESKVSQKLIDRYYDMSLRPGNRDALLARVNTEYKSDTTKLRDIDDETLIMWGKQDLWIDVMNGHKFKKLMPNAELIVYPNAGHVPMEEIPQMTATDALSFFGNN